MLFFSVILMLCNCDIWPLDIHDTLGFMWFYTLYYGFYMRYSTFGGMLRPEVLKFGLGTTWLVNSLLRPTYLRKKWGVAEG